MAITADLHNHTLYSHGCNTPLEMHRAAMNLKIIGFSEHSPRPFGYNCRHEYRERLTRYFPDYIREVSELKKNAMKNPQACQVLLGLEMDWIGAEKDFVEKSIRAYDYDYLIGSVHYLDRWPFDDDPASWETLTQEQCGQYYRQYFLAWKDMLDSGWFQIAAHPDLIKIFSVEKFHAWLALPDSASLIRQCLISLKKSGMAMEISSAGLRKPCQEIYPSQEIMAIAAELNLDITFASDAHCYKDSAYAFDRLADYARSFGFRDQTVFNHGKIERLPF